MERKFQPDAKWSCRSCGDCCRGFSFGPVEPHIVENLKKEKIEDHWPPAKEGWYSQNPQTDGYFFQHRDGHCVFLQENNLCAIHAHFGSEAKPWFCREYPFHVVEDAQGVSITVREDCGGFHKSFEDGESIVEQLDSILKIQRVVPLQRFDPERLLILPGLAVSAMNWLQVEPVLMERIKGSPRESVSSIRSALFQMAGRQGPPSSDKDYRACFEACTKRLQMQLQHLDVSPLMKEMQIKVQRLLQKPAHSADPTIQGEAYFCNILKNRLLSKSFARLGGLPMGLGFFLFERELMYSLVEEGTADKIGPVMSSWRRAIMIRPIWKTIRRLEPIFLDLFMYA